MSTTLILDVLTAVVRGEAPRWPFGLDATADADILDAARRHGLQTLVAARLREARSPDWPESLCAALAQDLRQAVVVEHVQREELLRVIDALVRSGVDPLLFKGTPLAYTCYPKPWLRPRIDTDVLVAERDAMVARRVVEGLGYRRSPLVDGSLVMRQAEYVRIDPSGVRHMIDLHWRAGNSPLLAELFTFDDLRSRAEPVRTLGEFSRAPCAEHALLLACAHHVAHHAESPRLIWRYDVHLLAGALGADELTAFARAAVAKRVARLCAAELAAARAAFGTRMALDAATLDAELAASSAREPSALYLNPSGRRAAHLLIDLRLLPTWRARAHLLGQHLFPSPAYMREVYAPSSRAPLPVLYAQRLLTGVWSWLRRSPA